MKACAHNEGATEGEFVFKGRELFPFVRFASQGQTFTYFPGNLFSCTSQMTNNKIIMGNEFDCLMFMMKEICLKKTNSLPIESHIIMP